MPSKKKKYNARFPAVSNPVQVYPRWGNAMGKVEFNSAFSFSPIFLFVA